MHYAHSTETTDHSDWQPLNEHLRNVARLAAAFASKFGADRAAALAGWLHDLGKYSPEFQAYIMGRGKGVGHADAGARHVLTLAATLLDRLVADILAYAIAGHHGGLPDREAPTGGLNDRLNAAGAAPDPIWRREIAPDATGLYPQGLRPASGQRPSSFQLAFLGRMIFSCLVDADFLDTEAFYAGVNGHAVDRAWPFLPDRVEGLIGSFDAHMAGKRAGDTPLNRRRGEILAHVRGKAALEPGVFTLDVPTGGGKTLASLAFALDHARRWGHERIVYAIPFTSIIDQTAAIFRDILGDDVVLEHHSAIETSAAPKEREPEREDREGASAARLRLAMENWAAPVVVTTNVQLFESLFANRPARCRKLHNLAKAVIILDEAQTIPLPVLRPCVAALEELARNYGCSIVLCTATQPALKAPRFEGGFTLGPERELAPDPPRLHRELRRVTLRRAGEMSDEAIIAELGAVRQGLVIVNGRKHALLLHRAGEAAGLAGLVHLTTRQTAADRRRILAEVRQRLEDGLPCRVIATSLIEAGVDVDFPRVWRAEAGLDQIAQAAGRCNREGLRPVEDSVVTIFRPTDAKPPRELTAFAEATSRVAPRHGDDLLSPDAIRAYFSEVYWQRGEGLDRHGVGQAFVIGPRETNFLYRTVADKVRLIEDGMAPVIVAQDDEAKAALAALRGGRPPVAVARRLQPYIVQIPPKDRARLIENGHVAYVEGFADQFAELKTASLYTRDVGLAWETADELGWDGIV